MKLEGNVQLVGFGLVPLAEGIPHEHFLDRWLLFFAFFEKLYTGSDRVAEGQGPRQ